jgi:hypothetical protein
VAVGDVGMSEPLHLQPHPRRRAVLAVGWMAAAPVLAGSALLNGCRSVTPVAGYTPPTPTPDEVLRRRAVARVRRLLAAVSEPSGHPALRPLLSQLAAGHAEQLAALGEPVTGSGTASATALGPASAATAGTPSAGTPAETPAPGTASPSLPTTPAAIVAEQLAAATEAFTDCTAASAGMAVLLARLAAAHAAGADLLASAARLPAPRPVTPVFSSSVSKATGSVSQTTGRAASSDSGRTDDTEASHGTPSDGSTAVAGETIQAGALAGTPAGTPTEGVPSLRPEQTAELSRLLQGEHAAVYAYGIVTALVAPALRARALSGWTAHLSSRNDLTDLLIDAHVTAPAASPAYDVGKLPHTNADAVALAAQVEGRLAASAAAVVGTTTDDARLVAARILITSARRQAGWTASVAALPG